MFPCLIFSYLHYYRYQWDFEFYCSCHLLQKHEKEVLAVVEKRSRKEEEEQEVHKAMVASLNEGWLLLLHLLERRQEVLMLVSDFYCRAQEVRTQYGLGTHKLTCLDFLLVFDVLCNEDLVSPLC